MPCCGRAARRRRGCGSLAAEHPGVDAEGAGGAEVGAGDDVPDEMVVSPEQPERDEEHEGDPQPAQARHAQPQDGHEGGDPGRVTRREGFPALAAMEGEESVGAVPDPRRIVFGPGFGPQPAAGILQLILDYESDHGREAAGDEGLEPGGRLPAPQGPHAGHRQHHGGHRERGIDEVGEPREHDHLVQCRMRPSGGWPVDKGDG